MNFLGMKGTGDWGALGSILGGLGSFPATSIPQSCPQSEIASLMRMEKAQHDAHWGVISPGPERKTQIHADPKSEEEILDDIERKRNNDY